MTSPGHPSDCPTDAALQRHALGGVVDDREGEHVLGCPRCQTRIEAICANNERIDEVAATPRAGGPATPDPGELDVPGHRVDGVLGAGGHGVVYRATQLATNRTVSLKVLCAGSFATARQRRRFEREIELVANLRHPNIAVVHDSGTTHGGRPYFTMEHVDGAPLDAYADAQHLGTHDRLAMLSTVCHAVQHAHRHGVIHRDLKPANILVTATGEPKILDFGVARASDADIQITTEQADVGQRIGTIPYLSPEQVAGDPHAIDVRSDVYALGVVAYKLLGRRMPHDLEQKTLYEAVRIIREDEPAPLSAVDRACRGDVETIIAKALAKDRTRRYQSAHDLAADIDRYLADEPIEAHSPGAVHRFRKFARRNRALVLGAAAVLVTIVAGGVLSLVLAVSATRDREAARAAAADAVLSRDEAEATAAFLETMLTGVPPLQLGRDVLLRDVLDTASAGMDDVTGEPTAEARVRRTLGRTYAALGDSAAAETHLRKALSILARERGSAHPEAVAALVDLASLLDAVGKDEEAGEHLKDALSLQRRAGRDGDPETLRIRTALARHYIYRAEFDLAESQLIAARDGWMQRAGASDPETLAVLDLLAQLSRVQGAGAKPEQ